MRFYVGMKHPCRARHFDSCMVSVNALAGRKSDFQVGDWILDSGAFTELTTHGKYRKPPAPYVSQVIRWHRCGNLQAAVTQDYMCEPFVVAKTGLSVRKHQSLTVERYDEIRRLMNGGPYLMPVLQGYEPEQYLDCLERYGSRIRENDWVGVGSVCKRNADPNSVLLVLNAILFRRPDLRLHGFGLKITALENLRVRGLLHSADSMAWSFHARINGRDANDWREAKKLVDRVNAL